MLPDYEIVLGRGIGQILFGMTKGELSGMLGDPNETYHPDEEARSGWETYGYDVIKCSFSFDPDFEEKLVEISVENGYFHLFHKIRVGLGREDLLRLGAELKFGEPMLTDLEGGESPATESISYDLVGLDLFLNNGIITMIRISALFNADHSISWPE